MKIGFLHAGNDFMQAMFDGVRERLNGHEVVSWKTGEDAPATDLELLIGTGTMTREQMQAQTKLGLIQTASAGYEGVDLDAANELGIWLSFAPSEETGNAISVAEFTVMLLLAAARRLTQALKATRDHAVSVPRMNRTLSGKTVAIIGMGGIGVLVAERLKPFGVKLVGTGSKPETGVTMFAPDQISEAIAEADFVVLAVRADEHNENLFDAEMLGKMKKGAVLVNVARGSLVDEAALTAAIQSGQVWGAGLDVTKKEPMELDNPLGMEEAIVTPHIAGMTDLMLAGTIDYLVKVVETVAAGKAPESVVNRPETPRIKLSDVPEKAKS